MAKAFIERQKVLAACEQYLDKREKRIAREKEEFVNKKFKSFWNRVFSKRSKEEIYAYFDSTCGRDNSGFMGGFEGIEWQGMYYASQVLEIKKMCETSTNYTVELTSEEVSILFK